METKKKPRAKVARSWGVKDMAKWKFESNVFPEPWGSHLGKIPERFLMYVDGEGSMGKSEYQMQLSKMLANHFGKVRYNNVEQGKHIQIFQSHQRNDFDNTIPNGKFIYQDINDFDVLVEQIARPQSGRVVIIDSISYFPLSVAQVQFLKKRFKNKSFVFVAYAYHYTQYKPVRHLCDIKVRVEDFIAKIVGGNRFGGTEDFAIWPERYPLKKSIHSPQTSLAL